MHSEIPKENTYFVHDIVSILEKSRIEANVWVPIAISSMAVGLAGQRRGVALMKVVEKSTTPPTTIGPVVRLVVYQGSKLRGVFHHARVISVLVPRVSV